MRNTWLLLKIQLSSMIGLNKVIHIKDKKERRKKLAGKIALFLCMLFVLPAFGVYAYMFASGMQSLGQIGLFPAMMLGGLCVMTLFTSMSFANGTLFGFKDYDLIVSLPVTHTQIAASRLLLAYVFTVLFDSMILLPCGAVYAYLVRPAAAFYPIFLLTMLAAPIVPMIIGSIIGVVIARILSFIKGGKYFQMLLTCALCLGSMSMAMNMEALMESGAFANIGVMIGNIMNRIYPLTNIYVSAVRDLSWMSTAVFVLLAAAALLAASWLMGRFMPQINTALTTTRARGKFHMRGMKIASPLMALYKKEFGRYVSSVIYLFNTAFGLLMALIGVIVLFVKGGEILPQIMTALYVMGMDPSVVVYALGYIGAFMIATCYTTGVSISLEGKNLWLIQSLPVKGGDVLMSKMMVNLTLTVPTSLIIGIGGGLALSLSVGEMALLTLFELAYALCTAAVGLMINLKNHSFDWTNEAAVVKQSAASSFTMLFNLGLILAEAILTFVLMEYSMLVFCAAIVINLLVGSLLVRAFYKKGDAWIRAL